jgi:ATP-dependent DNA helicase RecQ
VSPEAVRIAGLAIKILQRGSAPSVDPRVEELLVSAVSGNELQPDLWDGKDRVLLSAGDGDITSAYSSSGGRLTVAREVMSRLDSDEERAFLGWFSDRVGDQACRWLMPQPAFASLVARGEDSRRGDFLFSPPWGAPLLIEIDGSQHGQAQEVDRARDGEVLGVGIPTVRVSTNELRSGCGPELERIVMHCQRPHELAETAAAKILTSALAVQRIATAVTDGVRTGLLQGPAWVIEITGDPELPTEVLIPWFEVLVALDRLWGAESVAREITLVMGGHTTCLRFVEDAFVKAPVLASPGHTDLLIRLEPDRTGIEELLPVDQPTIVVRSAVLPNHVLSCDPIDDGDARIRVGAEGGEVEAAAVVLLRSLFAKTSFREGQLDALVELVAGRDCAVLLPTGAGKSLIYQLASFMLPGRTLVIDPLVSLIEDQVLSLQRIGVDRVVGITAETTRSGTTGDLLQRIAAADALFTFVAPERLQMGEFRDVLTRASKKHFVNLVVVDEAHCVSEWGHAFRHAYLNLGRTIRRVCADRLGNAPPILALTGTASRAVLRDVLLELGIERDSERAVIKPDTFNRPELHYTVRRVEPGDASAALAEIVGEMPSRFDQSPQHFFTARGRETSAGIVFVPHTKGQFGVDRVSRALEAVVGYRPHVYAGDPPFKDYSRDRWNVEKRSMAQDFKDDRAPVLVSTKAFGMGIDKPNVRYVVHFGIPGSIEAYYQEVGRAGRDGQHAECALLVIEQDEKRAREALSDDAKLGRARDLYSGGERSKQDDISRQMYFHLQSFQGVPSELNAVSSLVGILSPLGSARSVDLPFPQGQHREIERPLHRLLLLGVVSDYRVEFGSKKFEIDLTDITSDAVADSLLAFVRRNQPGREAVVSEQIDPARELRIGEAILAAASILLEFVYDTVERSRRRSLLEMWLAAREAEGDADTAFRERILAYLSQGAIAPLLEQLVEQEQFHFFDWLGLLQEIKVADDARELRGDAARLLGSFPDHPGLLLARGYSELVDPDGDLHELAANLDESIGLARERYGVVQLELDDTAQSLLNLSRTWHFRCAGTLIETFHRNRVGQGAVGEYLTEVLFHGDASLDLQVLALASGLDRQVESMKQLTARYERR